MPLYEPQANQQSPGLTLDSAYPIEHWTTSITFFFCIPTPPTPAPPRLQHFRCPSVHEIPHSVMIHFVCSILSIILSAHKADSGGESMMWNLKSERYWGLGWEMRKTRIIPRLWSTENEKSLQTSWSDEGGSSQQFLTNAACKLEALPCPLVSAQDSSNATAAVYLV